MNLVVFKLNHLGDNVVFVSGVQALRQEFPESRITVVTTPGEADLYRGRFGAHEILVSSKPAFDRSHRQPWRLLGWMLRVRGRSPDACLISFDQGTVAHLVAKTSGARIRIGANLEHVRISGSVTKEVPIPENGRPASWNWAMARSLAEALGSTRVWPSEPPAPDLSHLVPQGPKPAGPRPRILVHAGASRSLNRWPPAAFAAVASSLAHDFEVVWIEHGVAQAEAPSGTRVARVATLGEFAEWVAGSDLFLGNNSGPMHLANALGCPGVAVTGPTAWGWDPFWNRERWTVLRHPNLACAPCEKPEAALEGCANAESPMACLKYWTPERVEAACRERMARMPGRSP